ncbi:hypothetical protein ASG07_00580 [Sphingomonas sp. Leaf343]|nr:hypothetical protein ASG07_00580 [Sphingomonas sp. Leaf343]
MRLARYVDLTGHERDALAALIESERRLSAGQLLQEQGGPVDGLFVVQQGWLHSSKRLATGGRQILRFHYSGDLIGTSSIAWSVAAASLTAVSDCIVAVVPKANLGRLFAAHPRIGGLLYAVACAEKVAMADRLTTIGRMNALQRLTMLLLDVLARLRVTAGGVVDTIDLPLTQTDLGDALGLTKVHVNRTFRALEAKAMIRRDGRRVTMLDEAGMIAATGFVDRYREVATEWLPNA